MSSVDEINWIARVADGENWNNSSRYKIWGIDSTTNIGKHFIKFAKINDKMWFITNDSHGKIIGVATIISHNERKSGPLVNTMSNEDLGWETNKNIDTEIHYSDLYRLDKCELFTDVKNQSSIMKYNEKCKVNLPVEYSNIVRYSKINK
jgi:hypothetical protein